MSDRNLNSQRVINYRYPAIYTVAFTIIAGFISAFFHNPVDVPIYGTLSLEIAAGQNIYTHDYGVYSPLLYLVGGGVLTVFKILFGASVSPESIWTVWTFGTICTATLGGIYYLGYFVIPESSRTKWFVASLLNPFALFVAILYGQMTLFVVLGVAGAIYAIYSDSHRIGGALLALSASVKIYPAAIAAIYFFTTPRDSRRILEGAIPIVLINGVVLAVFYPQSLSILSTPGGVRPVNLLQILANQPLPHAFVDTAFRLSLIAATVVGILLPIRREIKFLFPIIPPVFFYPLLIEYRIVALALSLLLVGFAIGNAAPAVGRVTILGGVLISLLGTISMLLGSYQGWLEQALWTTPTLFSWPDPPSSADPGKFTLYRQWVVLGMCIVLVLWVGIVIWYRDSIKTTTSIVSKWRNYLKNLSEN